MERNMLLVLYNHFQFLSSRDFLYSIQQAPGGCAGLFVAPQGGPCLGLAYTMSRAKADLEL